MQMRVAATAGEAIERLTEEMHDCVVAVMPMDMQALQTLGGLAGSHKSESRLQHLKECLSVASKIMSALL